MKVLFIGDIVGECGKEMALKNLRRLRQEEKLDMVIANGSAPQLLYDIAAGRRAGTRFLGRKDL